jgi:hypothetical protein
MSDQEKPFNIGNYINRIKSRFTKTSSNQSGQEPTESTEAKINQSNDQDYEKKHDLFKGLQDELASDLENSFNIVDRIAADRIGYDGNIGFDFRKWLRNTPKDTETLPDQLKNYVLLGRFLINFPLSSGGVTYEIDYEGSSFLKAYSQDNRKRLILKSEASQMANNFARTTLTRIDETLGQEYELRTFIENASLLSREHCPLVFTEKSDNIDLLTLRYNDACGDGICRIGDKSAINIGSDSRTSFSGYYDATADIWNVPAHVRTSNPRNAGLILKTDKETDELVITFSHSGQIIRRPMQRNLIATIREQLGGLLPNSLPQL